MRLKAIDMQRLNSPGRWDAALRAPIVPAGVMTLFAVALQMLNIAGYLQSLSIDGAVAAVDTITQYLSLGVIFYLLCYVVGLLGVVVLGIVAQPLWARFMPDLGPGRVWGFARALLALTALGLMSMALDLPLISAVLWIMCLGEFHSCMPGRVESTTKKNGLFV